jgi:putative redox protein
MTSQIIYKGNLRTQATHLQSGNTLITDAPTDNHGMGEAFSPTDLLATSLGSCMLTIMGIKAADAGVPLEGTTVEITKIMAANPRRVGEIHVVFNFPEGLTVDAKTQQILENAAHTCPVAKSLHPDLVTNVIFNW